MLKGLEIPAKSDKGDSVKVKYFKTVLYYKVQMDNLR